jgi:hypothetical protein
MSRTEAVLRLYRAAREFTRRVTGVETLEDAALAYAREMGWVPPERAFTLREAFTAQELGGRIHDLETAFRELINDVEPSCELFVATAVARAREVLG